jgi:hypothetical protein
MKRRVSPAMPGPLYLAAIVLVQLACMTLFVWLSL